MLAPTRRYKKMTQAFRSIDTDNSGFITREELVEAVKNFALPIPLSHIEGLFEVVDKNHDGSVSYAEFASQLKTFDMEWAKTEERMLAKQIGGI